MGMEGGEKKPRKISNRVSDTDTAKKLIKVREYVPRIIILLSKL